MCISSRLGLLNIEKYSSIYFPLMNILNSNHNKWFNDAIQILQVAAGIEPACVPTSRVSLFARILCVHIHTFAWIWCWLLQAIFRRATGTLVALSFIPCTRISTIHMVGHVNVAFTGIRSCIRCSERYFMRECGSELVGSGFECLLIFIFMKTPASPARWQNQMKPNCRPENRTCFSRHKLRAKICNIGAQRKLFHQRTFHIFRTFAAISNTTAVPIVMWFIIQHGCKWIGLFAYIIECNK